MRVVCIGHMPDGQTVVSCYPAVSWTHEAGSGLGGGLFLETNGNNLDIGSFEVLSCNDLFFYLLLRQASGDPLLFFANTNESYLPT